MMMNSEEAYRHSSKHRDEVLSSSSCACFNCLEVFPPGQIQCWTDGEKTAFCPRCGIDSVLGDSAVPFTRALLEEMRARWFGVPIPSATEKVWAALRGLGQPRGVEAQFKSLELDADGLIVHISLDLHYRRGTKVCCGEPGCYVPFLGARREMVPEVVKNALDLPEPPRVELSVGLRHEVGFKYESLGTPVDADITYQFEALNTRT
jgi:hypothetical protein